MYLNISDENNAWLNEQCAAAHLTKSAVAELIITQARLDGWKILAGIQPYVAVPGRPSPAAGHDTPRQENTSE